MAIEKLMLEVNSGMSLRRSIPFKGVLRPILSINPNIENPAAIATLATLTACPPEPIIKRLFEFEDFDLAIVKSLLKILVLVVSEQGRICDVITNLVNYF